MSSLSGMTNSGLIKLLDFYEQDARNQAQYCEDSGMKDAYYALADLLDEVSYRLSESRWDDFDADHLYEDDDEPVVKKFRERK